jgi:Protein of unknown function (DUF2397)
VSSPFTYLTVGKSGLYRQVMLAFVAAKRRFTVHLRPEDVHGGRRTAATFSASESRRRS